LTQRERAQKTIRDLRNFARFPVNCYFIFPTPS
jgi:hypothetical protein